MSINLVSRTTTADELKASLDASVQRTRVIADRVSRASMGPQGFTLPSDATQGAEPDGPIDLESEMVSLADEQLRFDATAKLLRDTYAGLRESLKDK
ncbi:MAG: hypothetical protein HY275_18550 [Gemmatimonadetes bacterium]|nr:hypothetical protein [Gemmatimonadota bacterium]